MIGKGVAGIFASETQEHIVPPFRIRTIRRRRRGSPGTASTGSHDWILTKLQEQNLEIKKWGSLKAETMGVFEEIWR